jgi:hypothetical protein
MMIERPNTFDVVTFSMLSPSLGLVEVCRNWLDSLKDTLEDALRLVKSYAASVFVPYASERNLRRFRSASAISAQSSDTSSPYMQRVSLPSRMLNSLSEYFGRFVNMSMLILFMIMILI